MPYGCSVRIANDPMGVEQSDVYVILKPRARCGAAAARCGRSSR